MNAMCSPPQVVFEGEDGKDDGGLTVDAFSRLFKCLYDNEALGMPLRRRRKSAPVPRAQHA